ncbi:MAG: DsbA family protein [Chlamydiales bacterium]|nr:DsbA family protein [Chlamydiales bacterium]MBY0529901.1 DsbA family protein [Rhabdochlamydiaceae bacterium]
MVKNSVLLLLSLLGTSFGHSFEKLPFSYQIAYGNPDAPFKVVEYFSFTCPKCLKLIKEDFEVLKESYINPGKVYWVFHPDPADKLTLQALICLRKLNDSQKKLFFETVSKNLDQKSLQVGCQVMQAVMDYFELPLPELGKASFWESTEEFQLAFTFLRQEDMITSVPTIEINGQIFDEFPSRRFLEKKLDLLIARSASCE